MSKETLIIILTIIVFLIALFQTFQLSGINAQITGYVAQIPQTIGPSIPTGSSILPTQRGGC